MRRISTKESQSLLLDFLSKKEYDELVMGCDVGLVFLDHRFTIPNFPSRILSYMEYGMPILACTDMVSDVGAIAEKNGFGLFDNVGTNSSSLSMADKNISNDRSQNDDLSWLDDII